jgi:hypothetical protein
MIQMAKKTIKLTEQELNGLVKEAMNELDWKTYASAARKAKQLRQVIAEAVRKTINEREFNRNSHRQFDMTADFNNAERETNTRFPILHDEGNGQYYSEDSFATDYRSSQPNGQRRLQAPHRSYAWARDFSKYHPTPESVGNPKATRAYTYTKDLENINRQQEKFKKQQDKKTRHALGQADNRPMHRKNSLNRNIPN